MSFSQNPIYSHLDSHLDSFTDIQAAKPQRKPYEESVSSVPSVSSVVNCAGPPRFRQSRKQKPERNPRHLRDLRLIALATRAPDLTRISTTVSSRLSVWRFLIAARTHAALLRAFRCLRRSSRYRSRRGRGRSLFLY